MMRVITFDTTVYAEVADDKEAKLPALAIVLISAFAAGVSVYFAAGFKGSDVIVSQLFLAMVGWVLWVGITYFIGTQIFGKRSPARDWKSLLELLALHNPREFSGSFRSSQVWVSPLPSCCWRGSLSPLSSLSEGHSDSIPIGGRSRS